VAAETGFQIEGKVYEVPTLDSLSMGERRVMFELAGVTQEDFVREEDESEEEHDQRVTKLMRHPGFMESLMHIAYQRGNPQLKRDKVRLVIENTRYVDAIEAMSAEAEDDAGPPELTTVPAPSSPNASDDSSASSGHDSSTATAAPAVTRLATGTTRSATSPISVREISAT
jgi:hypothetical protein